jgi:hypothetical protein
MFWENSVFFSGIKTDKCYYNFKFKNLFLKYVKIIVLIFCGMFLTIKGNTLMHHLKIWIWLHYLVFKYLECCVYIYFLSVLLSCFLIAIRIYGVVFLLCYVTDWNIHLLEHKQPNYTSWQLPESNKIKQTVTITWRIDKN